MTDDDASKRSDQDLSSELARGLEAAFGDSHPSVLDRVAETIGTRPSVALRPTIDHSGSVPTTDADDSANTESDAGKYRVLAELGRGGVGSVHRGVDPDLGREVAIKFLHDKFRTHTPFVQRFVEEAQIGGQLQHPGIVPVYDLGMTGGKPFFAMKLIEGRDLADLLAARESLDSGRRRFLTIFEQVCQTVAYAHARGVVHRDLKPANVMVGAFGEVQVVDWGMGKVLDQPSDQASFEPERANPIDPPPESETGGTASTQRVATVRSEDESARSVAGSAMGTPAYMPREQALGQIDAMDERSDVFALGAMLCEVLTGHPPYRGAIDTVLGMAAMADLDETRQRLQDCAADPELIDLCNACLQKDRADRPATASVVADRVQTYLAAAEAKIHEARVAAAEERVRSVAARTRQRLALTLAAVVVAGLLGTLWLWNAAETNLANFNRLALSVRLDTARETEQALYPAWPDQAAKMRTWLDGDAATLRRALPELRTAVASLESRALELTDADLDRARREHPSADELANLRAQRASLLRASQVHAGEAALPSSEPDLSTLPRDGLELSRVARRLVDPWRTEFGREAEGLALARLALERAPASGFGRARVLDTLGWALLFNGDYKQAAARGLESLDAAQLASEKTYLDRYSSGLRIASESMLEGYGNRTLEKVSARLDELTASVEREIAIRFQDDGDRFLHATLTDLLQRIEAFDKDTIQAVERRFDWAQRVRALTVDTHRDRWAKARSAIAAADGEVASERYRESPLDLRPQVGLIPIGKNPATGLWEFYHLRSAWDPESDVDPATLTIPEHTTDGSIELAGRGLIFVLVPGGRFAMGAQPDSESSPNYDPATRSEEGVVMAVDLAPYFLSRYEMTQEQWARLSGGEYPSWWTIGSDFDGIPGRIAATHPVDSVTWTRSNTLLEQHGLALPTEAQWERACRAGTSTPWFSGTESSSLDGYANILDLTALKVAPSWPGGESFDDRYKGPSPAGTFRANPFGFHDILGNMVEWCRDHYRAYAIDPRPGDGLRHGGPSGSLVIRGGGFGSSGKEARVAWRDHNTENYTSNQVGVRPARPVR